MMNIRYVGYLIMSYQMQWLHSFCERMAVYDEFRAHGESGSGLFKLLS
jgi:hypothetical protein